MKSRDAEIDQRWGGVQGEVEGDVQTPDSNDSEKTLLAEMPAPGQGQFEGRREKSGSLISKESEMCAGSVGDSPCAGAPADSGEGPGG